MRVFVFVNRANEVGYRQTTALLVAASVRRGIPTYVASVDGLSFHHTGPNGPHFVVSTVTISPDCGTSTAVQESCAVTVEPRHDVVLGRDDVILIRTNPGRDQQRARLHANFLELAMVAEAEGIRVWNKPAWLSFFGSKTALAMLETAYRPPMLVSGNSDAICDFIDAAPGDCVLKPPLGSRGTSVLRLNRQDQRLRTVVQEQLRDCVLVVQHFVQADQAGDQRIVVLDGAILRHADQIAGIHRLPAEGDFRGNLHAGGTARPVQLTAQAAIAVEHAARLLQRHGIRLAGIDLIGDQIIEFNVFSTGGIYDANRFAQHDFSDDIVAGLLAS